MKHKKVGILVCMLLMANAFLPIAATMKVHAMSSSENINVNIDAEDAVSEHLTFLYFYAKGCYLCQKQKPIIDELEQQYAERLPFLRINVQEQPGYAKELGVTLLPTMFIISEKYGEREVKQKFSGFREITKLKENIDVELGVSNSVDKMRTVRHIIEEPPIDFREYEIGYVDLTVQEINKMLESSLNVLVVDVRSTDEFDSGHLEGAVSIPLSDFTCGSCLYNSLDAQQADSIIVYCKDGRRSVRACEILKQNGFENVYNMLGGITAWQDADFPVISQIKSQDVGIPLSSKIDDILDDKSVLVFFYADWCHFSQQQIPIIDELKQQYPERLSFISINVHEHPEYVEEFEVKVFPTILIITDKNEEGYMKHEIKGFTELERLQELIGSSLGILVAESNSKKSVESIDSEHMEMYGCERQENTLSSVSGSEHEPHISTYENRLKPPDEIPRNRGEPSQIIRTVPSKTDTAETKPLQEPRTAKRTRDVATAIKLEEQHAEIRNQPLEYLPSITILDEYITFGSMEEPIDVIGSGEADILVAGSDADEINPSMASDSNGNLYVAVEHGGSDDTFIKIYKSSNGGDTWSGWISLSGAPDNTNPSIAIGEGPEDWLLLAFVDGGVRIKVFRFDLSNPSNVDGTTLTDNVMGVSHPRIVTDSAEYYDWYAYIIYNAGWLAAQRQDLWVIRFSRSLDYGASWTTNTTIADYCDWPNYYDGTYAHPDIDFGSGRLYVAYDNYPPGCGSTNRDIYVINSTNFGTSWSSEVRLTTSADDEFDPAVAAVKNHYSDKTAVVAYTRFYASSDYDVQYAFTQDDGSTWNTNNWIAGSLDNEESPELTTSFSKGAIHVAYWHEYDIDYRVSDYLSPIFVSWKGEDQINEMNYASGVYSRPSIAVNTNKPVYEEAGIVWTDFRNPSYDIYFDTPVYTGFCWDYTLSAFTTPPGSGNWNINNEIECNDMVITLNGNLNIDGELRINNVTLQMNVDEDGDYSIEVNNSGAFYINSKDGAPSTITNGWMNASAHYTFHVNSGSVFDMRNSRLHYCGFDWKKLPNKDAGLWINTDNAKLYNNVITDNYYVGAFFYQSDGHEIRDNIVQSNEWYGLYLRDSSTRGPGSVIENNTVTSTRDGITLINCPGSEIRNNTVTGGDDGIVVTSSSNTVIDWNTANSNGDQGIIVTSSPYSEIKNNTANLNHNGIYLGSSHNCTVEWNIANNNRDDGIYITNSRDSSVTNNEANLNDEAVDIGTGIVVLSSPFTLIDENEVNENWRGMYIESSSDCTIANTTASRNTWYGIHLYQSLRNMLRKNEVTLTSGEWDSAGIYLSDSTHCTFTSNLVNSNTHGLILWYSGNAEITGNTAVGNTEDGISLRYSGNSNIYNNNNANSNNVGISLRSSHYVNINDNTALHCNVGISLHSSNHGDIDSNTVTDCTGGTGIYLSGSSHHIISANHAERSRNGISLTSSSKNNIIHNNTAFETNFGILLRWSSDLNEVNDNIVYSCQDRGANLFRVKENKLQRNDFTDSRSIGIYLEQSDLNEILHNYIASSKKNYGLDLYESDGNIIHGNDVKDKGIGISMRFSNDNDLFDNDADNNNMSIFLLESHGNDLVSNWASSNAVNGIDISSSNGNWLYDNKANSNPHYGIHLHSSVGNTIENNQVNENGVGVYLDWSTNNEILDNSVNNSVLTGIALYWSSNDNDVINNVANSNGNVSIRISSSDRNILSENTVQYNAIGIYLDWSNENQILDNNADSNQYHGISLDWLSNDNQIRNNSASYNIVGISLGWASLNTIADNIATNNDFSILLEWSSNNNELIRNDASHNTYYGISLFWSSNDNIITSNTGNYNAVGLHFNATCTGNTVNNNVFCNNSNHDIQDEDSNTGDDNTCSFTSNWNDQGTTGCTFYCSPAIVFSDEIPPDSSVGVSVALSELSVVIEHIWGASFDWSITTSPNVGSSSGSGEYNGTKTCSVSGLEYETTYTWTVSAIDSGSGRTTEAFYTFTTESEYPNQPPILSNENPSNTSADIPITTSSLTILIEDPEGDSFDWSITTSPNVGSSSGSGEYNGTKTCSVSGLEYETTYTWTVNAVDSGSGKTTKAIYRFTTESSPPPEPNLDCDGELSWTDVEPGSTVEDSFTVENIGDPESLLDWEVAEWPDWGEWTFTPSSGNDLTPEDGFVTIQVSVVAPDEQDTDFTGDVRVVNIHDSSDYCIIPVTLSTPVSKDSMYSQAVQFQQFLHQHR